MENTLVQYVRKEDGTLKGVVIATGPDNFGWALCRDGDSFSRKTALDIALGRAESGRYRFSEGHRHFPALTTVITNSGPKVMVEDKADVDLVTYELYDTYSDIYKRAQKYYK